MKILSVHNFYIYRGGEDTCREAENRLLQEHGHEVEVYEEHNQRVAELGRLNLAARTLWSKETYRAIRERLRGRDFDVMHVTNYNPLISPSAYYAAAAEGVAVVQTLQNYRLVCPSGTMLRGGQVCEDCKTRWFKWPGILHKCYRDSRPATAAVAGMLWVHTLARTWSRMVDVYVAVSPFARKVYIEGGLPASRIEVKPNFIHPDPGVGSVHRTGGLFVGRLSPEKGILGLVQAWRDAGLTVPLAIAGDGPLAGELARLAESMPQVELLGKLTPEEVYVRMKQAAFLLFPSRWYEGLPLTIVEAFATGTPVLSGNLGAMGDLIESGHNGLHVEPNEPDAWIRQVQWAAAHPEDMAEMGRNARTMYEEQFTAARNLAQLEHIYQMAMDRRRG